MKFNEIVYLLMKMNFFDLLLNKNDKKAAELYYYEYFRQIGKVCRRNWERKEQTFMKILKNPLLIQNKRWFAKNMDDFMLELNRTLYNFLFNKEENNDKIYERKQSYISEFSENNLNNINLGQQSNPFIWNLESPVEISEGFIFENNDGANNAFNENCNNIEEIKDLSQYSTKEEFSDFEEEIENQQACIQQLHQNLSPSGTNQINENPVSIGSILSHPEIIFNSSENQFAINQNFLNFIENQNDYANKNIQVKKELNLELLKEKNSTLNIYQKQFIPKTLKNEENLIKKLPMLKSFKPKYTKRENIDKKIIRKFKLFLQENKKDKILNIYNNEDNDFWIMFINGVMYPPFKHTNEKTGMTVQFKSFNTKFLLYLFNKKMAREYFDLFLKIDGNAVIANISSDYGVNDNNDLNQLRYYLNNMAFIFDLNMVDSGNASKNENNFNQAPMPQMEIEKPSFSNLR